LESGFISLVELVPALYCRPCECNVSRGSPPALKGGGSSSAHAQAVIFPRQASEYRCCRKRNARVRTLQQPGQFVRNDSQPGTGRQTTKGGLNIRWQGNWSEGFGISS